MGTGNHSQMIVRGRKYSAESRELIINSSNLFASSRQRISKGNNLVAGSTKRIGDSWQRISVTITVLIGQFLASKLSQLSTQVEPDTTSCEPVLRENFHEEMLYLTPQENLRQIMTHPFTTGKCPNCGYELPKKANCCLEKWDCPECGWIDDLFE